MKVAESVINYVQKYLRCMGGAAYSMCSLFTCTRSKYWLLLDLYIGQHLNCATSWTGFYAHVRAAQRKLWLVRTGGWFHREPSAENVQVGLQKPTRLRPNIPKFRFPEGSSQPSGWLQGCRTCWSARRFGWCVCWMRPCSFSLCLSLCLSLTREARSSRTFQSNGERRFDHCSAGCCRLFAAAGLSLYTPKQNNNSGGFQRRAHMLALFSLFVTLSWIHTTCCPTVALWVRTLFPSASNIRPSSY